MGNIHPDINDRIRAFIEAQHMFFVSTAPLGREGHINCSPKGTDSFRIIGPTTVAYLDYNGSGVETIAHLRENGRIVIMFCAFEGYPDIVRLHGRGEAIEPGHPDFADLVARFEPRALVRSVIRIEVSRVASSCGHGVPLYSYQGDRTLMMAWSDRKGVEGMRAYQEEKNAASIDGLPGLASLDGARD